MKKLILSLFLLSISLTSFSKTWVVTNKGTNFLPSILAIEQGDSVSFVIGSTHNVVEVSKEIWDADEASPLLDGFQLPMGGGLLLPAQLSRGVHYYVCVPHVSLGMKGTITVLGPAGIASNIVPPLSLFPNPANAAISIKTTTDLVGSDFIILDVTGKLIMEGKLESRETLINISALNNGIYFLQANSPKREMRRFVKN